MTTIKQENNSKEGRFTIYENEEFVGEMTYTWEGNDKFIIDHTKVDKKFSGKGFAKELVMAGIDFAREKNVKIVPICDYVKGRFDKDESIRDVLAQL